MPSNHPATPPPADKAPEPLPADKASEDALPSPAHSPRRKAVDDKQLKAIQKAEITKVTATRKLITSQLNQAKVLEEAVKAIGLPEENKMDMTSIETIEQTLKDVEHQIHGWTTSNVEEKQAVLTLILEKTEGEKAQLNEWMAKQKALIHVHDPVLHVLRELLAVFRPCALLQCVVCHNSRSVRRLSRRFVNLIHYV